MQKLTPKFFSMLILGSLLSGCGVPTGTETILLVATDTSATRKTSARTETLAPAVLPTSHSEDTGWEFIQSGLERRGITLRNAEDEAVEDITILRIDPDRFHFDVAYDPQGRKLEAWLSETGAEVIVNGGYFREEQGVFFPDGLVIAGGKTIGESYGDFAGMFAVGENGPQLRWLRKAPYDPAEPLSAVLQCFPILIKSGGQIGFPAESEDGIRARRTVIGQDRNGRILFLIAARGFFTLHRLSVYLHDSDLELEIAMNLDGGPSTGMAVAGLSESIPAEYGLPVVFVIDAS
jgi:hypothetical protein